jgi:hypothetical protein
MREVKVLADGGITMPAKKDSRFETKTRHGNVIGIKD